MRDEKCVVGNFVTCARWNMAGPYRIYKVDNECFYVFDGEGNQLKYGYSHDKQPWIFTEPKGNDVKKQEKKPVKNKTLTAIQFVNEKMGKDPSGCASFAVILAKDQAKMGYNYKDHFLPDGRQVLLYKNAACHYPLQHQPATEAIFHLSSHLVHMDKEEVQQYKAWISWLINKSVVRNYIEKASTASAFRYGLRVDGKKHSSNIVACVALFTRIAHEYRKSFLPLWSAITKAGVHPGMAMLIARQFTNTNGGFKYATSGGGHDVMNGEQNLHAWMQFWDKGFGAYKEQPWNKAARYVIQARIVAGHKEAGPTINNAVVKHIERKKNGWAYDVPLMKVEEVVAVAKKVEKDYQDFVKGLEQPKQAVAA